MKQAVNADEDKAEDIDQSRREFSKWLWRLPVIAALGGAGYAAWRVYTVQFSKVKPVVNPVFEARAKQEIADLRSLNELWDTAEFVLEGIPAILIVVPEAIPGGLSVQDKHYIE